MEILLTWVWQSVVAGVCLGSILTAIWTLLFWNQYVRGKG